MSHGLNWNRRKPVFRAWYEADLLPWNHCVSKHKQPKALRSPPKSSVPRPPLQQAIQPPKPGPSAFGERSAIRTSDLKEAREKLSSATWAVVHTDGSAVPNPGRGGFAAVLRSKGLAVDLFGGEPRSTNNRMELTAAVAALEVLPVGCRTTIISDSKYVIDGSTKWISSWRRKGWSRDGKPLPNDDLWRRLDALINGRSIKWQWIRGHNGDLMNELADMLATLGRTARGS